MNCLICPGIADKQHHPEQYSDFKKALEQIAKHPNERYFILKSIIINNLFGVDIMPEAVEICKLRLFLKLVAQVDTVSQIEPLPDIDFNIRAGNTLVGFASLEQVRKSQEGTLGFGKDQIKRIEEDAEMVEQAFRQFRVQQTRHGGKVTSKDKQELRDRLAALDAELDCYLAGEYGISADKFRSKTAYAETLTQWKASHQPFHWFAEFYGIMHSGGFDVIIGNPPYVEYSKVKKTYTIRSYSTESCGNLYAFVWERCLGIAGNAAMVSMIQPVAAVCTDGYEPLQTLLRSSGLSMVSNFNDRPSKLFDGLEHIRLCIVVHRKGVARHTFSTTYNKWQSVERPHLFQRLSFIETTPLNLGGVMAKVGAPTETSILTRLRAEKGPLGEYEHDGKWTIYYTRKLSHFVQVLDFIPAMKDMHGREREPSELKRMSFASQDHRDIFLCILNSSLFYWILTVYSDCRNLNRRDIGFVRFDFTRATKTEVEQLQDLCVKLMADIRSNSNMLTMRYKDLGELHIQCTYPKYSKAIIDEIDRVIGSHYGLTEDEVDFIINYDIKYRMGQDAGEEGEG